MPSEAPPQDAGQGVIVICILLGLLTQQRFHLGHGSEKGKMAEPSLFAQRLQAITERCRLREKILHTRRELEEERLRAQRLKRKSLRDRWLMEGMSAPTDDHNHTSPAWEGQSRIQELEQDLSSLESQMQQLDNPELLQEREKSKEPAKAVKEALGISSSPPEGRSGIESSLEPVPVPSKRTVRAVAEETLQNGEMSEDGLFGIQPALQSQTPNEAHPSNQRKLAVEEMVIRDHLGQAVGSMDAVGQKQSSIQKELEDDVTLGNGCKERNRSGPLCGEEEPSSVVEGKIDGELGSRDGPEGESPTSWDQEGPSKPLKDENISLEFSKEQEDGELFRVVVLLEDGGKRLPEEGVQDHRPSAEPVLNGKQYQLNMESLQHSAGTEITALEQVGKSLESLQEQPKPSFPDQNPPESEVSLQNPVILSSTSEQTSSHILQETKGSLPNPVSFFQETKGPLLKTETSLLPNQNSSTVSDQMIHLVESQGSVGAQIPSLVQESYLDPSLPSQQDHFSSPVKQKPSQGVTTSLEESKPSLLEQIPLHGADGCHLYQTPTSLQEHSASLPSKSLPPSTDQLTSLPEKISSSSQETESSPIVLATLEVQEACVVEAEGCTPDVISSVTNNHASLANEINSSQEAKAMSLEEIPVEMQDQTATSPMTQPPSLPGPDGSLPGKQRLSSMNESERLLLEEASVSTPDQVPPVLKEPGSPQEKTPSLPEQREPLLPNLVAPSLPEPGKAQSPLGEERSTTLQSQTSPVGEVEECQGKQIPQTLAEERSTLPDQSPSTHRVPNPALQETEAVLDVLCSSSQDPVQPLLETAATMEDQMMEEDGSVSRASRATEAVESLDILENVPTEEQPLLNELKASAAPPEMCVGDQEPKPLVLKSQAAPSQEVPTYHTSSANTASSRQLLPHEGEGHDQGQSRRKQKSCQCCSVM